MRSGDEERDCRIDRLAYRRDYAPEDPHMTGALEPGFFFERIRDSFHVCPYNEHVKTAYKAGDNVDPEILREVESSVQCQCRDKTAMGINCYDPEQRKAALKYESFAAYYECEQSVSCKTRSRSDQGP